MDPVGRGYFCVENCRQDYFRCGDFASYFGHFGPDHVLHPPRIVPPGYTLIEKRIRFQQVDLYTEDGASA